MQRDSSSQACTPSSPPHSSSLWVHEKKSITLNGRGWGGPLLSLFSSGMLTCQRSVSAGWKSLPHPAIHLSHKGNFTGRQAFSPPFFLTAPRRLSIPSSLPHTHSHTHTHSQAVISILMDAQESVNVTKWETWGEKKNTSVDIEKVRLWNGSAALYPQHSPGWLWVWSGCWWVWINLLNTARPQGLNPSDWWIQGKSHWSRFHWFHLFFLVWQVVSSLVALTLFFFIHLYCVSQALS